MFRFIPLYVLLASASAMAAPGFERGPQPALLRVSARVGKAKRFGFALRRTPDTEHGLHLIVSKRFGDYEKTRVDLLPGADEGTAQLILTAQAMYDPAFGAPPEVVDSEPPPEFDPDRPPSRLPAFHKISVLYRVFTDSQQDIGALEPDMLSLRRRHADRLEGTVGEVGVTIDDQFTVGLWRIEKPGGRRSYFRFGAATEGGDFLGVQPGILLRPPIRYVVAFQPERAPKGR